MLKAVIFDMDGVIIDSEPLHAKAAIEVMKQFGVTIDYDLCYSFIGSTDKHMFEVLKEQYHLSNEIEDFLTANKLAKESLVKQEGYPAIPYIKELIMDLAGHNVKLAIASSSPMDAIKQTVVDQGLTSYFTHYVSGMDLKNPKPAPDIFLRTCELLEISPSEALVIEDSTNGVNAAKAAGIPCIGFQNPGSGNQNLSRADMIVEGFDEVDYSFICNSYLRAIGEPLTIATTSRLIIRELSLDDIKSMYKIYMAPEVREFIDDIDDYLTVELEKHKAYIQNIYRFYGYGYWGVFSRTTGELIGRCGIQNSLVDGKEEIELGYLLDVKHWGYGYAIECTKCTLEYAFFHLYLKRIVAVIDKLNTRSIKVAEHIGMHVEKELKRNGRDCYLYVIENPIT